MRYDEKNLVTALQKGEERAFQELVENYSKMIYSTAFSMLQNADDAQDAAQEVFLSVYRYIGKFKKNSKLSTWIYRITVNSCMNVLKKKRLNVTPIEREDGIIEIADNSADPEGVLLSKITRREIADAISALESNQRAIIVLRDIENLSYEEISEILHIPVGTVKSRINRARCSLREHFKKNKV